MNKEQIIYYDATFQIIAPHRGMATYLSSFLNALASNGENIKGLAPAGLSGNYRKNIVYYGLSNILFWEQFSISKFINRNKVNCFIFPYNTGPVFSTLNCTSVLILHDLIFMEPFSKIPLSKSLKQIIGRIYRRSTGPRMIKRANFIITVSNYSKERIIESFKIDESKIAVIQNCIDGYDKINGVNDKENKDFFLNVGGDAPHKNTVFLINGYANLPVEIKMKYSLKIVGISNMANKKILTDLIKSLNEESNIYIYEFVDDAQLEILYQNAFLFIFPSLTEGFGIPLLEAMKFGCSVACSNTSSMPEVCKDAAFYFDPTNMQSFIEAVCVACNDHKLRTIKKEEGAKQIDFYSRSNFNRKVLDWYEENIKKKQLVCKN